MLLCVGVLGILNEPIDDDSFNFLSFFGDLNNSSFSMLICNTSKSSVSLSWPNNSMKRFFNAAVTCSLHS